MNELARSAQAQYDEIARPVLRQVAQVDEVWKASLPANWRKLSSEDLLATLEFVKNNGLCLVWVPRPELVIQLVNAGGDQERNRILEVSSGEVVEDLSTALAEIGPDADSLFAGALATAREAVEAAQDGHFVPAQTASAAGLTAVLHEVFGFPGMGGLAEARKKFEGRDLDEVGVRIMKISMIELCTAKALKRTKDAGPGFNRHGSQHGMRDFLSQANSLAGMMLLVAWVRELWWFQERHPEVFRTESQ